MAVVGIRGGRTHRALLGPPLLRACLVFAAFVAALFLPSQARAACTGAFTYTHTGTGGSNYNLNGGQSLRVQSGTYTGTINNLSTTATICVDEAATFTPNQVNNPSGKLLNYGKANLPNMNLSAGFQIDNFGRLVFTSSVNFNGAVNFRNRPNADMIFRSAVQIGNNSVLLNDGRIIADQDFNLSSGTNFTNNFDVLTKGTFNPSGAVSNYGRIWAEAFININGGAAAKNYCSWIADQGFNNNSNLTENYGLIFINWTGSGTNNLWQNNATFKIGPDSTIYGWRFMNNSTITNTSSAGGGRFYFKEPAGIPASEHTKNQGPFNGTSSTNQINFYDETRSNSNIFDVQGTNPTNTFRQAFTAPPIDYASPDCSVAIRQILYDPNPPAATYDYSDAPASYGAPVHQIVAGLHLGAADPDWDGGAFATANADGDDLSGSDDEDSVAIPALTRGSLQTLNVTVAGSGYLQAWIDYNGDGDFADAGEQIATNAQDNGAGTDQTAGDGKIRLQFTPPPGATSAQTFLRLRWSAAQNLDATSASSSGEVEDHAFVFGIANAPEGGGGGSTASSCPASGDQLILQSGGALGQTSSGTITDPAKTLGTPTTEGAYATSSNSAKLSSGAMLILDLTADANLKIPAGGDVVLSIARDVPSGRILIEHSLNGTSWTSIGSYGLGGTLGNDFIDDVLDRVMFEAPAAGTRYVRLTGQSGTFWVDGVTHPDLCGPKASLTIVKSSSPFVASDFMLPQKDVAYTIQVSNSGYGSVDSTALTLVDTLPPQLVFYNGDFAGTGGPTPNPLIFSQSGAGLDFFYANDVGYSNAVSAPASFAQCTYTPAAGYDPAVRHVCIRPSGSMKGGPGGTSFTLRFRARIK